MNSRERVMSAFAHEEPDRVPCWCDASTEFWDNAKAKLGLDDEGLRLRIRDDFRRVAPKWNPPKDAAGVARGMFGIHRSGVGLGISDTHPLASATLQQVHDYAWPDVAHVDVSHMRQEAMKYQGQ